MKLYHVNWESGEIETITVIEESIADGAINPTYIVRYEDGSRARVSKTMYHTSKKLALQEYGSQLIDTIQAEQTIIYSARKSIQDCNKKLRRVDEQIATEDIAAARDHSGLI